MNPRHEHCAAIRFAQGHNPLLTYIEAFQQHVDSLPQPRREGLVRYISEIPVIKFSNDLDVHFSLKTETPLQQ